jgi:hypothetical protein
MSDNRSRDQNRLRTGVDELLEFARPINRAAMGEPDR